MSGLRHMVTAVALTAILACAASVAMAYSTDLLPPPEGSYTSNSNVTFVDGTVLRNIVLSGFTNSIPAPQSGIPFQQVNQVHSFGSTLDLDLSQDYGLTWMHQSVSVPGSMSTTLFDYVLQTRYYQEQLTGLTAYLYGGSLILRESPIQASTGFTEITPDGSGGYDITSFFDVFFEITSNGGITWIPANASVHIGIPEPSSLLALVVGISGVVGTAWRKRR